VAHGHPELSPGGAEWASYLLFQGLKRVAGVEPHFLAYREAWPTSCDDVPFVPFAGRPDETVFSAPDFDYFLFS
jgi:hypothetical protein